MLTVSVWWVLARRPYSRSPTRYGSSILSVLDHVYGRGEGKLILVLSILGADVKTGSIYCSECDNLISDATFEELFQSTTLHIEEKETKFLCECFLFLTGVYYLTMWPLSLANKKRRENYKSWKPDSKDNLALSNTTPISCTGALLFRGT